MLLAKSTELLNKVGLGESSHPTTYALSVWGATASFDSHELFANEQKYFLSQMTPMGTWILRLGE